MTDQSSQSNSTTPEYLLIGEILRPHGVNGEVRMRVLTHHPEHLAELETVYLARRPDSTQVTPYELEHVRMHQGYALLTLKGVNDRDKADLLRQLSVLVAMEDAIPLDEGEVYLYQLIGLEVKLESGERLGEITEVLETGANDVYIVKSPQYGEVLIPATDQTILHIDVESASMIVKLPDGLLPSP